MTQEMQKLGQLLYPPADNEQRPLTREDCADVSRPCVFVSCKYNLYLDVNPETGTIKLNFPDIEPDEMGASCALDVAEEQGATLEDVGVIMNMTRERIRQIEELVVKKLREEAELDVPEEDVHEFLSDVEDRDVDNRYTLLLH